MPTGHRTAPGFFVGCPTDHRTAPGFETGFLLFKKCFFRGFQPPRNEAPEGGGREELLIESQEGQELSAGSVERQLVLNMSSEDQTVDHTYMLMGNDHETIFIDFSEYAGQEDTNFENSSQRCTDLVLDMCTCVHTRL